MLLSITLHSLQRYFARTVASKHFLDK